jgi:hypothetical protein
LKRSIDMIGGNRRITMAKGKKKKSGKSKKSKKNL